MQVLYGDNEKFYASQLPIALIFRSEFPSVWEFILAQKMGLAADSWKALSRRMQERESRFMIGRVCTRLMEHHPEVPILTIHDSILTPAAFMPVVHRVLAEEFMRLDVKPAMRIEGV